MKFFLSQGFLSGIVEGIDNSDCHALVHVESVDEIVFNSGNIKKLGLDINDGTMSKSVFLDQSLWDNIVSTPPESQIFLNNELHAGMVIMILSYQMVSLFDLTGDDNLPKEKEYLLIAKYSSIGYLGCEKKINEQVTDQVKSIEKKNLPVVNDGLKIANMTLSDIMPNKHKWIIEVVVLKVGNLRAMTTKPGNLQRFRIRDASGCTEMVVFNEQIVSLGVQSIEPGKVYRIENGTMRAANQSYRQWPNEFSLYYDLHCNANTVITELASVKPADILGFDESTSSKEESSAGNLKRSLSTASNLSVEVKKMRDTGSSLNFTSLGTLEEHQFGSYHNILAIVVSIESDCRETRPKNRNKDVAFPLMCRNIKIIDKSRRKVNVTFWGKEAEDMDTDYIRVGSIIMLNKVKLKSFNGVSLSKEMITKLSVFNEVPSNDSLLSKEIQSLSNFYNEFKKE